MNLEYSIQSACTTLLQYFGDGWTLPELSSFSYALVLDITHTIDTIVA